jgi:hypothetical protein
MADYGIKISKPGYSVTDVPSETTKKNYIILDTADAHKILYSGFVSATSYTHNLGYVPLFLAFETDSVSTPTYFKPLESSPYGVVATTTQLLNLSNPSYIIIFYRKV